MKTEIKQLASHLYQVNLLKKTLSDKEYWINKAAQETDFVPREGDWISVEVTLFKIEVSVHHNKYGGAKYWKNGMWTTDPFTINYPDLDTLY